MTAGERPILVYFSSRRSGPARRMEGFLDQVLQRRHNHETFRRHVVDVDERPELAERFGVDEVPTVLVIDSGRVARRIVGRVGVPELRRELQTWLR